MTFLQLVCHIIIFSSDFLTMPAIQTKHTQHRKESEGMDSRQVSALLMEKIPPPFGLALKLKSSVLLC